MLNVQFRNALLLKEVSSVYECDATMFNRITKARYQKTS